LCVVPCIAGDVVTVLIQPGYYIANKFVKGSDEVQVLKIASSVTMSTLFAYAERKLGKGVLHIQNLNLAQQIAKNATFTINTTYVPFISEDVTQGVHAVMLEFGYTIPTAQIELRYVLPK
jgi:hypothetical protein